MLRGGEVELAYAVCKLRHCDSTDVVLRRMAGLCEVLGLHEQAIDLLRDTKEPMQQVSAVVGVGLACLIARECVVCTDMPPGCSRIRDGD